MRKFLGALIVASLLVAPINAIAAVKAGDACKKAGSTATVNGKKFTCVKSGKKLVWNKGVVVTKPKPEPVVTPPVTPSPKPSATASPSPTISPQPIVEKAPSGFDDLVENFRGVYVGVWNSSNSKIEANAPVDVSQNILVGPNSKLPSEEVPIMFSRGTRFLADIPNLRSLMLSIMPLKILSGRKKPFFLCIRTPKM